MNDIYVFSEFNNNSFPSLTLFSTWGKCIYTLAEDKIILHANKKTQKHNYNPHIIPSLSSPVLYFVSMAWSPLKHYTVNSFTLVCITFPPTSWATTRQRTLSILFASLAPVLKAAFVIQYEHSINLSSMWLSRIISTKTLINY